MGSTIALKQGIIFVIAVKVSRDGRKARRRA